MPDWDDVDKIVKAEVADAADGLRAARDRLDAELTRRERELAATPQERMDMVLADIEEQKAATDALLAELDVEPAANPDQAQAIPGPGDDESVESETPGGAAESSDVAPSDAAVEDESSASKSDNEAEPARPAPRPVSELQVEYEQRKAKADDLLDELRDELGIGDS